MTYEVLISYARGANQSDARALESRLRAEGIPTFLDEKGIDVGEEFLELIIDALLQSRVVVVLLSDLYFTRPYCWWEWETALTAYKMSLKSNAAKAAEQLDGVIVALSGTPSDASIAILPERVRNLSMKMRRTG